MSYLSRKYGLTDKQAAFAEHVAAGGLPADALRVAGYGKSVAASYLMRLPAVRAAVHDAIQRAIEAEAPASLAVLREIRNDKKAPAKVRADISMRLLGLAGHVLPTKREEKAQKPLAEMTREEMLSFIELNQAAIDKAEAELAARATDVTVPAGAPKQATALVKPLDYLD